MGAPQYEQAGADIGGTGTTNTIPRWTGPSTLGDSGLIDDGSVIYTTARNAAFGSTSSAGYRARVLAAAGAGSAFGLRIDAGTNSTDYALRIANQATTSDYLAVRGDGNVGIGTATPSSTAGIGLTIYQAGSGSLYLQNATDIARIFQQPTNLYIDSSVGSASGSIIFRRGSTVTESARIDSAGRFCIGTPTATTGRALTTVADLDVFGVRVGRGGDGSQTSNTALGRSVLGAITTGDSCTGVGALALQSATGSRNTGLGYASLAQLSSGVDNSALGSSAAGNNTGSRNTAIGSRALQGVAGTSTGSDNVCIGERAGDSITTGASNIVIGSNADVAAAGDSNQFVLGDATNYVATNGGATTYYATAGASLGYMRVRLNGTYVKIEVFADV